MKLDIIHLNIERDKHLDSVFQLIKDKNPDVVCLEEAILEDIKKIALELKYEFAFAPLFIIDEGDNKKEEGSAILSRFPIIEVNKYRYDDDKSNDVPVRTMSKINSDSKGKRPKDRFLYHSTLLSISIKCDDFPLIIATTHFPVVDHSTFGLSDHELDDIENIKEIENAKNHLDRLVTIIRSINQPMIFTADLNNTRGEYVYNTVAHELIDIVPYTVVSTIDPKLHRCPDLNLLVDTIMTSPNIRVDEFEIVEGVSDHKALIASLNI